MSENDQNLSKSLKQVAYETLKHKIVSCEILPGTMLTEDMLCDMLNASRTPVRDAVSASSRSILYPSNPKKASR